MPSSRRHLRKILAGLVLLVLSSAVWGVLNQQRQMYALEGLGKAFPSQAPAVQFTAQEPGPGHELLLLGDSRIADWKLPMIPGWRVVNAGVPGLTTAELRLIAPEVLAQHTPRAVVIQAGVNELKIIGVRDDLFEPLVSQCHSNLLAVARLAEARGAQVFLTPVWPTGVVPWQRSVVWSERVPQAIEELNQRLRTSLAEPGSTRLLDVFGPSLTSPALSPLAPRWRDTLHFTPEFYQELTQRLTAELDRTVPKN